jgi:hypothetical protein
MSPMISLKEAERKVFTSTFRDGLWDIFIGCVILQFAVGPLLTDLGLGDFWSSVVFLPFYLLAYLGLWAGKKFIVAPRIGLVTYHRTRKARLRKVTVISLIILVIGVIVGLLAFNMSNLSEWIFPAILSAVMLGGFSLAAYFLDFTRLYVYGVLVSLSPLVGELLFRYAGAAHHGYPIVFGVSGGLMILTGLFLFIRFLRDYPIPVEGSPVEEGFGGKH